MENSGHRTVRVAVFTHAGWISGLMHVPQDRTLLAEINEGGSFFRLTDASLPLEEYTRDFFAVLAREATMVIPLEVGDQYASRSVPDGITPRQIVCLLEEGTVLCNLDVLEGCRVSDHLLNHEGFITIREIHAPVMELPQGMIEPIPVAYLNSQRIIGVTESDAMKADPQVDDQETLSTFSEI
jgi:hypothetical protein